MKDGQYEFHFVALGKDRVGRVNLKGNLVEGGDPLHAVRGQLSRAGANVLASFEVAWRSPPAHRAGEEAPSYTIRMFGSGTHTEFSVIGLAPLGLIVEFRGNWCEPLQDDRDDAAVDDDRAASAQR